MTALPRGHRASVPPLAAGTPFVLAGLAVIVAGLERGIAELVFATAAGTVAGLAGGWWLFGARKLRAGLAETQPPPQPRPVDTEPVSRSLARFALPAAGLALVVGVLGALIDTDIGVVLIAFGAAQLLNAAIVLAWERRHGHHLVVVENALRPVPR